MTPATPPLSGATIPISYTVSNIGTRATRESKWYDRIYLSADPSLDTSDQLIGTVEHGGILAAGDSYTQSLQATLPDGVVGDFHVLVFTDSNITGSLPPGGPGVDFEFAVDQTMARVGEFRDEGNNITAAPMSITLAAPPDLRVTQVQIPQSALVGQTVNVSFTVTNSGSGPTPALQNQWKDQIYLSRDQFLDLASDRFIDEVGHTGIVNAGNSYVVNDTITLPRDLSGAFYVFVVTDPVRFNDRPRADVFEGDNERNNASPSPQPLLIELPPPSDLQVSSIVIPASAYSGDPLTVTWTATTAAGFPAAGSWSDAAYLSSDAVWDIGDKLLGKVRYTGQKNAPAPAGPLAVNELYTLTLNTVLPPTTPGTYRVIIRPDILNEVNEGANEANNRTASASSMNVTVDPLQIGVPLDTDLDTAQDRLYGIDVPAGATLRVDLTTAADTAANELFLRYNDAPTAAVYDATYTGPRAPNQTLTLPTTLPGTYYLLVSGDAEPTANTPITLYADLAPLSITDVSPDQGGDSRWVTMTVRGAQFSPNAIVKLVRPGIAELEPVEYQVIDSTKIIAIFDLSTAPHGLYDVSVINPDGQEAVVPYRYLVERALEPEVAVGLGGPRVILPGDVGLYGFSVRNLTNVDLPYVNFTFGLPELGTNPKVFGLKYVVMSTNLRGTANVGDVPWADITSQTNTTGEILAPGYAVDLPAEQFAGLSFTAFTYPGLKEILAANPHALDDAFDEDVSFPHHRLGDAADA